MIRTTLLLSLVLSCKGEPEPEPEPPEADPCADVPMLTWDSFGRAFLTENCNGCHAATTLDRNEAPIEVNFDTPEQAWALSGRILARSTGETPTMPPNGGVDPDDLTRLEWWLECGSAETDGTQGVEIPSPGLDVAEVEAAVAEALVRVAELDPLLPFDAFDTAVAAGDADCPEAEPITNADRYRTVCEASTGAFYDVDIVYRRDTDFVEDGRYYVGDYRLDGDGVLTAPGGSTLSVGSDVDWEEYLDGTGARTLKGSNFGVLSQEGDPTWLGQELSVGMEFYFVAGSDGQGAYASLNGGVSGYEDGISAGFVFYEVTAATAQADHTCAIEPSGEISILGRDGEWYDVVYSGPLLGEPVADPADCDGCGDLLFRGESIGEACPDIGLLLGWEDRPW